MTTATTTDNRSAYTYDAIANRKLKESRGIPTLTGTANRINSPNVEQLTKGVYESLKAYAKAKKEDPNAIAMVRVGDFYEMYDKDAVIVADTLELVLTSKFTGSPELGRVRMTGIPYFSLDRYLRQLKASGFQVAVIEKTVNVSFERIKDTFLGAPIHSMKLGKLKDFVYRLASQVLGGVEITSTKQLKKFFSTYDFRKKPDWINLAIALQNRVMKIAKAQYQATGKAVIPAQ